jgi:hypothetical protein
MPSTDSFYIYLNSVFNINEFPQNALSHFTNIISPPIQLDGEFRVGLENIFFKDEFYTITENDSSFGIKFHARYRGKDRIVREKDILYKPTRNIQGDTIAQVISFLNNDVRNLLIRKKFLSRNQDIIFRLKQSGKVDFKRIRMVDVDSSDISNATIQWNFGEKIASLLGVIDRQSISPRSYVNAKLPNPLSKILIYSDIVQPSHMGKQIADILDILPIGKTYSKNSASVIYKRARNRVIDTISISMRDEYGNSIPFIDGGSITLILHFKRE